MSRLTNEDPDEQLEEWIASDLIDAPASAGAWDLMRSRLDLTPTEQRTLAFCVACECSIDLAPLVARATGSDDRAAPDVELLQRLFYSRDAESAARFMTDLSPSGTLTRLRLLEAGTVRRQDEVPFMLRKVRSARRVVEWLYGHTELDSELEGIATLQPTADEPTMLLVEKNVEARVMQVAANFSDLEGARTPPLLVLTGPDGAGRRSMFRQVSQRLCRPLMLIDCDRLPFDRATLEKVGHTIRREALLLDAIPVLLGVDVLAADGNRTERYRVLDDVFVRGMPGLVGATAPKGITRPSSFGRGSIVVEMDVPTASSRAVLWSRNLGREPADEATRWAADRYAVTGGVIEKAAQTARARANARGDEVRHDDIHAGVRTTLDANLSRSARRLTVTQSWADVVLPGDTLDEVCEIISRVKHRDLVFDRWGLGAKIGKGQGVSVLFSGPPGTGKTMVAGIIANDLGLDLYQVDLSQTVSKYIGETEKNLGALFDAAEAGHAVLLFDEADSMFARRTEVRSSNDRYANLEVNYLLQRMESFSGISILTTNLETSLDEAFRRRLSFRIAFPVPDPEERELMWRTMLPPGATCAPGINFKMLAERYEMSGGYIKNAVVRAAFMAADRREPIGFAHLQKAASLEYSAMGKVMFASS